MKWDRKTTHEHRYYIGSIPNDVEAFAKAIRTHWGMKNKLHGILDVAFCEDESRIRKKNAAENSAVLRHFAINFRTPDLGGNLNDTILSVFCVYPKSIHHLHVRLYCFV